MTNFGSLPGPTAARNGRGGHTLTRGAAHTALWLLLGLALGACASSPSTGPRRQAMNAADVPRLAPYSSAVRTGNLIFFSGLIGNRPGSGSLIEGGIREETRQALDNLTQVMTVAGVTRQDVVKCTVFLADIRDYSAMNEVYGEFFRPDPPARSAIGVSGLPAGARVEIECIAVAR